MLPGTSWTDEGGKKQRTRIENTRTGGILRAVGVHLIRNMAPEENGGVKARPL